MEGISDALLGAAYIAASATSGVVTQRDVIDQTKLNYATLLQAQYEIREEHP